MRCVSARAAGGAGFDRQLGTAVAGKGTPKLGAYTALKAAVASYTRTLALELAGAGVRAVCLAPGPTKTGLADKFTMAALARAVPLGRPAETEEMAAWVTFLASSDARFANGATFTVDGGVAL